MFIRQRFLLPNTLILTWPSGWTFQLKNKICAQQGALLVMHLGILIGREGLTCTSDGFERLSYFCVWKAKMSWGLFIQSWGGEGLLIFCLFETPSFSKTQELPR